ncbi:STM4015 family protein [Nocardiopsis sp. NPDC049922]|uniref:STM4015 family protein n=1 Tax=Nocardiopsis sp. NPDC049922 TaxID=3155157 RepID=UPI0033CA8AF6
MPIDRHITEFAGLPVVEFPSKDLDPGSWTRAENEAREAGRTAPTPPPLRPAVKAAVAAPESVAWRLRTGFDEVEDFAPYFSRFLDAVDTSGIAALVIGGWGDFCAEPPAEPVRDLLIEHADRFPALRSLFFGEIIGEEYEISWIKQTDMAPLLAAFPRLTEFTVRGAGISYPPDEDDPEDGLLELHVPEHRALRRLTVQSGGLPDAVGRQIAASGLPSLEHLELWLGVWSYGGTCVPDSLAPVLSGTAFPELRSLGLRNAEDTDVWVRVLADSPLTERLEHLDLSMGTLTDRGASVLLDSPVFRELRRLDLHHHYLSEDTAERLRTHFTEGGVEIDLGDRREPYADYDPDDLDASLYPAVTE